MIAAYYDVLFILSIVLTGAYFFRWHRHDNIHLSLVFTLVPVINLGYVLMIRATTPEAALMALKFSYLGGCYLELMLMMVIFDLCGIQVNRWIRLTFMVLSTVIYLSSLTIGEKPWFYESVSVELPGDRVLFTKQYGVMHTMFIALVTAYFLISLGTVIYTYVRKNQISRKILYLLFIPEAIAMLGFFGGRQLFTEIELLPASYVLGQIFYLAIARQLSLHDVTETAIDSLVEAGDTGLVSFDFKHRYLGSNRTAKQVLPELNNLTVDHSLKKSKSFRDLVDPWLTAYEQNPVEDHFLLDRDGKVYQVEVSLLYNHRRKCGYQLRITDDTEEQNYIRGINSDNEELNRLVEEKTAHIVAMHDQLIMSMATMVESRDNSTGGHIRRTSEGVRLLIEANEGTGTFALEESFRKKLIKAAPMHDLGKIAVDDQILRKPGRFEPEEYEKMKQHAPEGGRIVHEILKGTDDDEFHEIAENVAHYHHERWDGKGYPDGLTGEGIPLEARIMAVADVYDALVSKRVYKDKMSFEKANGIILEGMGSQFDPAMEPVYLAARPALEAYYSSLSD